MVRAPVQTPVSLARLGAMSSSNLSTYRGTTRIVVLTVTFVVGAAFFGGVAVMTRDSVGWAIGSGVLALVLLGFAVRFPFMRVVAAPDRLTLHGPVSTAAFTWQEIASITGKATDTDGALFRVHTPVLTLNNGKKVEITPAASYRKSNADRIAADLESWRQNQLS